MDEPCATLGKVKVISVKELHPKVTSEYIF